MKKKTLVMCATLLSGVASVAIYRIAFGDWSTHSYKNLFLLGIASWGVIQTILTFWIMSLNMKKFWMSQKSPMTSAIAIAVSAASTIAAIVALVVSPETPLISNQVLSHLCNAVLGVLIVYAGLQTGFVSFDGEVGQRFDEHEDRQTA
jgi:hypothetical protein